VVSGGGLPGDLDNVTVDYLYSGDQCVEERDGADAVLRQYVWGLYVDELVQQKEKGDPDTDTYLLSDLLYRSVALTDDDKDIQEAYDTDAYGNTLVFSDPDPADGWFGDDDVPIDDPSASRHYPLCRFVFTGRSYDVETGIYFYRARYYHAELGRFVSRDRVWYYYTGLNLWEYASSAPVLLFDPSGFASVQITAIRGWYSEDIRRGSGQARWCFKFTAECVFDCEKPIWKWSLKNATLDIRLAITLDPGNITPGNVDGIYGHEARHIRMMEGVLQGLQAAWEAQLEKLEERSKYQTKEFCENAIKTQRRIWDKKMKEADDRRFRHASTPKEEAEGHPVEGKEYPNDPWCPAGESKGEGLPFEVAEGWKCSKRK